MSERALGKITALLADRGLDVPYAYDDLVFVQECAFLLQFTADPKKMKLFINTECEPEVANDVAANMVLDFDQAGYEVTPTGRYFLTPNPDETLHIEFR